MVESIRGDKAAQIRFVTVESCVSGRRPGTSGSRARPPPPPGAPGIKGQEVARFGRTTYRETFHDAQNDAGKRHSASGGRQTVLPGCGWRRPSSTPDPQERGRSRIGGSRNLPRPGAPRRAGSRSAGFTRNRHRPSRRRRSIRWRDCRTRRRCPPRSRTRSRRCPRRCSCRDCFRCR